MRLLSRQSWMYSPRSAKWAPTFLRCDRLEDRTVPDATMLDLTSQGSMGEINGAVFQQSDMQPTGTGHIDSFLRIQGAAAHGEVQQGYNTDARPLQFDENKSPNFTRALELWKIPVANVGGTVYRVFQLDVNQKSSQPYLSLDQVQIFVGENPALTGYDSSTGSFGGSVPVYDLDAAGDSWVKLDYRLNSGSGSGDMLMYVPNTLFLGGAFVTMYARFGEHFASNAGFQEWAVGQGPLPSSLLASISGTKFRDLNGNGLREEGENGIQDWVIFLDTDNDGDLDDGETYTVTDENGNYRFDNLLGGLGITYVVREQQQEGWMQTTADPLAFFLMPGEIKTGVDFGNFMLEAPPS